MLYIFYLYNYLYYIYIYNVIFRVMYTAEFTVVALK